MDPNAVFELLTAVTLITLMLCVIGIGFLILPFVALLWILYVAALYFNSITGAVFLGFVLISITLYFGLRSRKRKAGK